MSAALIPETTASEAPPRAITDGQTILALAYIEATAERIFQAMTTKEVETWWGSADTYRVTHCIADLRVGGRWSLDVRF